MSQTHKRKLWGVMVGAAALVIAGLCVLWLAEHPKLALLGISALTLGLPSLIGAGVMLSQAPARLGHVWLNRALRARLFQGLVLSSLPAALWLAHEQPRVLDLTYTRATSLSEATGAMIKGLEAPLTVRLFAPQASELRAQLEPYLAAMRQANPDVQVQLHDQAESPALARALGVYTNGTLTLTLGRHSDELELKRATRALELGDSIQAARATLRVLDEQVLAMLRALSERQRHIYVIEGADELTWRMSNTSASTQTLYKIMTELVRAEVEVLPMTSLERDGAPKDADLLVWTGPRRAISQEVIASLSAYLDRGGALWLLVDPAAPALSGATQQAAGSLKPLLKRLGLTLNQEAVASMTGNAPLTRSKADRLNLLLTHVDAHPATKGLLEGAGQLALLVTLAGALEVVDAKVAKGLVWTDRAWLDQDGDLELDAQERQGKWALVAASQSSRWRAVVVADAQMVADESMLRSPGNQQLTQDLLLWLLRMERSAGQAASERDVRVSFDQGAARRWLWVAIFVSPLLLLLLAVYSARSKRPRHEP